MHILEFDIGQLGKNWMNKAAEVEEYLEIAGQDLISIDQNRCERHVINIAWIDTIACGE